MSLTSFIGQNQVAAKLKVLRPPPPRVLRVPILVPPRSNRYSLIGTAFDYLLRFEIKRRAPHAKAERWVAENAAEMLFDQRKEPDGCGRSMMPDDRLGRVAAIVAGDAFDETEETSFGRKVAFTERSQSTLSIERFALYSSRPGEVHHSSVWTAYKIGKRLLATVNAATVAHERYIQMSEVSREDQEEMAGYSIRLAAMDMIYRAAILDELLFREPECTDVQELVDLLAIVPFDSILCTGRLFLNPTFGEASHNLGGADADLIAGDALIEVKTTKKDSIEVTWLDQLFGLYLLARNQRTRDPAFPEIKRLALYFARHGFLWIVPVSQWVDHPGFADVEGWFCGYAGSCFARA